MRILHVINRYWPAVGGAEAHLGQLSKRLVDDGHQVTVLTTDALDPEIFWIPGLRRISEAESWHEGVRIIRLPVRHLPFAPRSYSIFRSVVEKASRKTPLPMSLLRHLSCWAPWVPALRRWLRANREPFDLVAGMNILYESVLLPARAFARRRRIPFVIYPLTHLGAGEKPGDGYPGRFYTMRHQIDLVCSSDALAAQTAVEKDFYLQHGALANCIQVIGPGIDPVSLTGGQGEGFRESHHLRLPIVAMLSSLSYDKGTRHLIEAAQQLWSLGRNFSLVLAGTLAEPLPQFLASIPASDRQKILLLGSIHESGKKDLLAATDIFAMPSRTDSFGMTYLEAWFYGKPVIGAKAWGVNAVIDDGRDGLLVRFGDVPDLARAIDYLLQSPEMRETMGAAGQDKVMRLHTWARKYALVSELYTRLARNPE